MSGDLYRNSRALKQIRSLSACGWRVHVIALVGDADRVDLPATVHVDLISISRSGGYRLFREIRTKFSDAALQIQASCYHASDLYVLRAMAEAAQAHDATYTYDSRELYPYVAATNGRPWVRWYWSFVEERYIRGAALVFTVSKRISKHLESTYGIRCPLLVRNVPPRTNVSRSGKLAARASLDDSIPIILHLGQMRKARGCEVLVRAMTQVDHGQLVFMGYGPEEPVLKELTRHLALEERVTFVDPVSPDEVLDFTSGATVGVTLLEDTCLNHRYALPNKLFDYLSAGVPVLASDLPELRAVVQGYNVGKTVNPQDLRAVVETLTLMIESEKDRNTWIRNAERLCETFNWENASQRFTRAFRSIMPRSEADSRKARAIEGSHQSS